MTEKYRQLRVTDTYCEEYKTRDNRCGIRDEISYMSCCDYFQLGANKEGKENELNDTKKAR